MTKRETSWYLLFVVALAFMNVEGGIDNMAYAVGAGTLFWMLGHAVKKHDERTANQ